MSFGLGNLRLSPSEFWSMTVPEIKVAVQAINHPVAACCITEDIFLSLQKQYPDKQNQLEQEK